MFALLVAALPLVPYPQYVKEERGSFNASGAHVVASAKASELSAAVINEFAEQYALNGSERNRISFRLRPSMPEEAYAIKVRKHVVKIHASSNRGFVYAIQTLKQLLTASNEIPCVTIKDSPRFGYRGMHLDCARKYYSVDFIKKYLDIMAFHKLNVFHWHLTDDHGWRLEIKKYPRLVEVGAFGNIGSRADFDSLAPYPVEYEGYYTQDDVREVVEHAAKLGINVIPEIDLPGHMTAAMAAYPWLGCTGGPYEVIHVVGPRGKGLARDSLCPGKESTFEFIEDVLAEVMSIFPGKYIHLGGDECIKDRWAECPECCALVDSLGLQDNELGTKWQQLEVWMINRLSEFLAENGRKAIVWDEMLEGALGGNATVMSWRGVETGIKAAKRGYDVIMCPVSRAYFDYSQSGFYDKEPKAFAGIVPIDSVYFYDPQMGLSEAEAKHVIGAQANMWCDVIGSEEYVEYMLLPRLAAFSEVQWCKLDNKDWGRFKSSMDVVRNYYDANGYIYARHLWGVIGLPGYDSPIEN